MRPRVLAAAVVACGLLWTAAGIAYGWWGLVTVLATTVALVAYAAIPSGQQQPLPQRQPGAVLEAADNALQQFTQAIADYETCLAIETATQHTHPHRKEN